MSIKCVCCKKTLNNDLDTFGYVGQEMCWDCYSGLFEDAAPTHYVTLMIISADKQPFITVRVERDYDIESKYHE